MTPQPLSQSLFGLTLSLFPSQPAVPHGKPVTLNLVLSNTTQSAPVSGIQFTISLPTGWTIGTPILDPSVLSMGKFLSYNTTPNPPSITGLIFGLNVTPFTDGPVLVIPLTSPIGTPPGLGLISLSNLVAATPEGVNAPLNGVGNVVDVIRHHFWRRHHKV